MAQTKTITQTVNSKHLDILDAYIDYVEIEKGMHPGAAQMWRTEVQAARNGDLDSLAWLKDLFRSLITNPRTAGWMTEAQEKAEEMRELRSELN